MHCDLFDIRMVDGEISKCPREVEKLQSSPSHISDDCERRGLLGKLHLCLFMVLSLVMNHPAYFFSSPVPLVCIFV